MTDRSPDQTQAASAQRLGYLLSKYPSANHTYLLREVLELRRAGLDVVVAAVDGDDRHEATLPEDERRERSTTFVVKRAGIGGIFHAHLEALLTRPLAYFAGAWTAMRLSGPDLRRLAYHAVYFVEAVVAGRYLWRRGCRHVHTHYASTVALLAARVYSLKLSASIHGSAEFIDPAAQRLREKVAACVFVRTISQYGLSQLMLAAPPVDWAKLEVVRLGIDLEEYRPTAGDRSSDVFRLVSVGQLQPAKGFHILLGALATLVRAGRDVTLTLVGDGPSRAELLEYAATLGVANRVTFTGALTRPEVRSILARSDAFVLPSFAEGIPVVLMEAMAAGVVCVASRITGIPELIREGSEGILVTPADVSALTLAIDGLIEAPEVTSALISAARRKIAEAYDLRTNVEQLAGIFRRYLELPIEGAGESGFYFSRGTSSRR